MKCKSKLRVIPFKLRLYNAHDVTRPLAECRTIQTFSLHFDQIDCHKHCESGRVALTTDLNKSDHLIPVAMVFFCEKKDCSANYGK